MSLQWTPSFSVGVELIDKQHQELFRRVAALQVAIQKNQGEAELERVITFLEEYVVTHFLSEEAFMQMLNYPALETHKKQHERFITDFKALKAELTAETVASLALQIESRLVDWLKIHVCNADMDIGAFLNKKQALIDLAESSVTL